MALDFPSNPTDGQTYNGWAYSSSRGAWEVAPSYAFVPVAAIMPYRGSSAPTGWLFCDGSTIDITNTAYTALASLLGDMYGTHSGNNYYLPNMQGRVPVAKAGYGTFDVLGAKGGEETHLLNYTRCGLQSHSHSTGGMIQYNTDWSGGSHYHTLSTHNHSNGVYDRGAYVIVTGGTNFSYNNGGLTDLQATSNPGSVSGNNSDMTHHHSIGAQSQEYASSAHNNLQPYVVLNYIIKY